MEWKKARKQDFPDILPFLMPREWYCVTLTSRLKEAGFPGILNMKNRANLYIRRSRDDGSIEEILYHSYHGMVIPVLDSTQTGRAVYVREDLREAFGKRSLYLYSILGRKHDVLLMEHVFERPLYRSVEYFLMTLETTASIPESRTPPAPGLRFRRAGIHDEEGLYPLQREYELEEVLLNPGRFSEEACRHGLRNSLRNELIVLAELDGKVVAKAGTNARGFTYDQLGGVFTDREYRNQNIGEHLIRYLLEILIQEGRNVCLFVKKDNPPANALYRKVGFSTRDEFRISYYGGY